MKCNDGCKWLDNGYCELIEEKVIRGNGCHMHSKTRTEEDKKETREILEKHFKKNK